MIIIFVKLILELLLMSSFWFGLISLKKEKYIKRSKKRINTYSIASFKMVRLVLARREEKKIEPNFTDIVGKW